MPQKQMTLNMYREMLLHLSRHPDQSFDSIELMRIVQKMIGEVVDWHEYSLELETLVRNHVLEYAGIGHDGHQKYQFKALQED